METGHVRFAGGQDGTSKVVVFNVFDRPKDNI